MRFAGLLVCITLLFSICIMPVSADKADEGWEKYFFNYSFPYSDNEDYEYSSEKTNYDGVPDYFQIRSVCVPAYSGNELKCSTDFMILYPLYSPPVTIYNGKKNHV